MPTLRVELLKSREEDEEKDFIVEKRVVHSNRVTKVAAGYPQQASSKLKKCNPTEPKQAKQRVSMGKALGITPKLSSSNAHGSLLASYKAHTPQSPSESDSFSIRSSSSSSKSEADSIKKPSPPTSLVKPNAASLHMNLGSYFGDLSKAIHEKFEREETLQNGFLEFRFAEGRMIDTVRQIMNEGKIKDLSCAKGLKGGCVLKNDALEWGASEVATPGFHTPASTHSSETFSEAGHHSGDPCSVPFAGHELKQSRRIKELTAESEEGGNLCDIEHDAHNSEGCNGTCISQVTKQKESGKPFEADVTIDTMHEKAPESSSASSSQMEKRLPYSRNLSCHLPLGKQYEEGFSFQVSPCKDIPMQEATSRRQNSVDPSTYPGVVSIQGKPSSSKICLEKYFFSTPLMVDKDAPSPPSHEDRGNYTDYLHGLSSPVHAHDFSRKLARSYASAVTPPPSVEELKGKANFDERTPVSPLSLSETSPQEMFGEECARDHFDTAWPVTSNAEGLLNHPSKTHWDWRSKSIGARASLKSAVRNLEAAFGGSRSVSLPKTRSQTSQRERKSESSKFIDRVFVSPAKNRHKRSEGSTQSIQRLSYSGSQVPEGRVRNGMPQRRNAHCHRDAWDNAGSNHCLIPPSLPPLHKQSKKSGTTDFKVSTIPFLPSSRSDLPGHISPLVSTPPSSALSHLTMPASCMRQGYLQCFQRDGTACYTLSLKDSEEMLLARACTFAHNSSKEGSKCLYTFQSGRSKSRGKGTNGWKSWLKKDGKFTTDVAGKMQVSSELCCGISPTGKRVQFLVSEFVLYDERNDDSTRSQSLRFLSSSQGCHDTCTPAESPLSARSMYEFAQSAGVAMKLVPNIPRSPSSTRMSSKLANISHIPQPCSPVKKRTPVHYPSYSIDVWSDSDVAEPEVQRGSSSALHSELAAIVIKMPMDEDGEDNHQFSNGACRRSLNFSYEQAKAPQRDCRNRSVLEATSDAASPGTKQGLPTCTLSSGCVTMMLPKEHHGLPKGGVHGPTSLIDRWRGGGKCDCGGWDLGCGMKVFSTQRCEKLAATADSGNSIQSISHKQPLILYSQQGKTQEVLLSVSLVQEGYFILKFHNELPPLKAFAATVAILHSRESSSSKGRLMPIVKACNQQCQSDPETIGRNDNRPVFLEVYNDIPTWFPSDGRSASPYGRA